MWFCVCLRFWKSLSYFFWLCPWQVEVPKPGLEHAPQQQPEPLRWQCGVPQENSCVTTELLSSFYFKYFSSLASLYSPYTILTVLYICYIFETVLVGYSVLISFPHSFCFLFLVSFGSFCWPALKLTSVFYNLLMSPSHAFFISI